MCLLDVKELTNSVNAMKALLPPMVMPDRVENIADELFYLRGETGDFAMFKMVLIANECKLSPPFLTPGFNLPPTFDPMCDQAVQDAVADYDKFYKELGEYLAFRDCLDGLILD